MITSPSAEIVRKAFTEGAVDEIISTRRLVDIVKANNIFNNKEKAIAFCLARFDEDTKECLCLSTVRSMSNSTSSMQNTLLVQHPKLLMIKRCPIDRRYQLDTNRKRNGLLAFNHQIQKEL